MAHVLIATDMSANALNAAAYAIQLFGMEGNNFTLLNAFQTPPALPDQPPPANELAARISAEDLEIHARKLLEALPEPTPDLATVSAYGSVDMVVRDLVEDAQGPDIVVMGTHSMSGPERMFLGSTTAAAIKSGVLPVLAVPAEHELAGASSVPTDVLAGADVLLLTDGHCLRDQALEVCSMVGASERHGFRATSLETLRQMVAAGVGVTLLPKLSVSPPVAQPDEVRTVTFEPPVPNRRIAMFWRRTSVHADLLTRLAGVIADLPDELLRS